MKSKASLSQYSSNSTCPSHQDEIQNNTFPPVQMQEEDGDDLYYFDGEENEIHADSENDARPIQDQIEKSFSKESNNKSEIGK